VAEQALGTTTAHDTTEYAEDRGALMERDGNAEQTFVAIYEQHYSRIFNYVMRSVMNVSVAEDIVSETFLKALHGLPGHKGGPAKVQAWLYRIATNAMTDHFRRSARETRLGFSHVSLDELSERGVVASPGASGRLEDFERYQTLHHALRQLDDIYRLTIILYYFEEKRLKEVARILDCTLVAAKWRLHRARRQLGAILDMEEFRNE
jgi:RNA polymerase sigma-70 factor (ECF subfamily)